VRRALTSEYHPTLRLLGGILFGIGCLVLVVRRGTFPPTWGEGAIFITLAVPAALLYGGGLMGARVNARPTAWQSAFTVFGLLLIPLALLAFLDWIGGDTDSSWNTAWIFGLTGVLAFVAGLGARVRYGCLLGSLALIIAWFSVWDEILSDGLGPHVGTTRWLFVLIGMLLLALAGAVAMRRSDDSSADIVTAAGIALVIAGGVTAFFAFSPGRLVTPSIAGEATGLGALQSSLFWDLELLVVSLALVAYGVAATVRGTTYVGAIGLLLFVGQVGFDLDDKSPSGHAVGWPLVLLIVGALALAASVAPALRRRS
jgi:hypothetical protein